MAAEKIGLSRDLLGRVAAVWLILCWPLLAFGGPAYFPDSTSYYKGGAVAVAFVRHGVERIARPAQPATVEKTGAAAPAVPSPAQDARNAKGARSITYSVASYLLAGPGSRLIPLVALQALVTAFCLVVFLATLSPLRGPIWWGAIIAVALATPAAWFASYAMPDIFAGTTILTLALLATRLSAFSTGIRLLLIAIAGFGISAHASHIGLAIFMVPAMALCLAIRPGESGRRRLIAMAWVGGTVAAAGLLVVATALVGFGEISIAPKRYPLTLGRSLEQGPARWYLQSACATKHYQVCELYPEGVPATTMAFLWGPRGVSEIATPAQMDRLRREEGEIILAAARAYPLATIEGVTDGFRSQLVYFGLADLNYARSIHVVSPTEIEAVPGAARLAWLRPVAEKLTWAAVLASILASLIWLRPSNRNLAFASLIVFGVLANAAICATFSAVAERYQGRVIWLVPLAALALWAGRKSRLEPDR